MGPCVAAIGWICEVSSHDMVLDSLGRGDSDD